MQNFSETDEARSHSSDTRLTLDRVPGLVAAVMPGGKVEHANRQLQTYLGGSATVLTSWTDSGLIHPEDVPQVLEALADSLGESHELEYRVRRGDGLYRWVQGRGLRVRDGDSATPRWYLLLTDIEDRRQAEVALRRSEALLAACQSLSLTGTFCWSLARDQLVWSTQLYRILEIDPSTPASIALIEERVHPADLAFFRDSIGRARETGDDFEYELRLRMPSDSVKYLQVVAHASGDADLGLEYIGAVQDVTERRLADQLLSKARSELARVNRVVSVGMLSASIAHEINQPLSGIITNANTCLRMLAADPPNVDGARETARRTILAGNRAADVTARLRALFSHKKVNTEPVDLNEVARDVLVLSLADLRKNRVLVRQELASDLPLVSGDRVQLQQVVLNLLLNAWDAMTGVDDRPRQLLIRTERDDGDQVRLTVRDSGVGFEPSKLERLFEAFYTTKSSGMGIGLSVSRSIVESHGGRLWAAPNDGPGATFAFSLRCLP